MQKFRVFDHKLNILRPGLAVGGWPSHAFVIQGRLSLRAKQTRIPVQTLGVRGKIAFVIEVTGESKQIQPYFLKSKLLLQNVG